VLYLNTANDEEVRDMFRRLNKFLTPLKPQELRNATYMGPFAQLALKLADSEYWVENRIVRPVSIRRMGDVEFTSELLIGLLHGPQGGGAGVIDSYYAQYEDFEDEFPDQKRVERLFEESLKTAQSALPNIKDTRWSNKTDFYSLFVAMGSLLKSCELQGNGVPRVRKALTVFAAEVDKRLGDEEAKVSKGALEYVRAVEKGANEKQRRATRHAVLIKVMESFFRKRG
jgi:hypothetical protein